MADIAQALSEALKLHRAGEMILAERLYRQILQEEPECADAWHLLGVLTSQSGRHLAAAGCIGHAIGLNPNASTYHNNLGLAYQALFKRDEALACYRRALELNSDYADAHNNLGVLLRDFGKSLEAEEACRRAVQLKPDYAEAHHNLGIALMDQAKMSEAIVSFRRALQLKPEFAEAHKNLGVALLDRKKYDEAVASIRRALELRRGYSAAQKALGDAFWEEGKIDDAAACYRLAIEGQPNYAEAYNNLSIVLMKQGKLDEAISACRRALELIPEYVEVHNHLGVGLKLQGNLEGAIASYRRALALHPNYPEAYNNLANALYEQGNSNEAEASWRRALELKPDFADAYGNLAMMLYRKGRLEEAAAILKHWLGCAPDNPVARHMAASFTGRNVPARAADDFIRYFFDHFAQTFDKKIEQLEYHAPELVAVEVARALGAPRAALDVVDAGCGTGRCGQFLRPYANRLIGVDLSPAMLEKARARQAYDDLIEVELTAYLQAAKTESCDLIASADTLVYFGDLKPFTIAAARVLRSGGSLIFTLEKADDAQPVEPGFLLQPHGRYCHTEHYVRSVLRAASLGLGQITPGVLRLELGRPVHGMVVCARKP